MATIIITGGAGYIGSHTIIELLEKTNYDIVSVDNFSNSSASVYDKIKSITGKEFKSININLCDKAKIDSELSSIKNIEGIIHFAAFKSVPESVQKPFLYYQNNLDSLNNILQFAVENKINNFIFSSSCSVYGNSDTLPVTEKTPLKKSISPYGHTKQIGEEMIDFICNSYPQLKSILLRYFNPVGAHMSGKIGELSSNRPSNLVPIITQTAVGKNSLTLFGNDYDTRDGSCIRDYIHVSDIANAHVKALDLLISNKNKKQLSLYNLGTGNGVSVLEAIHSFEKISKTKLSYKIGPRREGDVIAIYADNKLATSELEWQPEFNLDDMMLSAWKWQLNLEKNIH